MLIAFYLFIEAFGGDAVEPGEMGVEYNFPAPDEQDERFDTLERHNRSGFRHRVPYPRWSQSVTSLRLSCFFRAMPGPTPVDSDGLSCAMIFYQWLLVKK